LTAFLGAFCVAFAAGGLAARKDRSTERLILGMARPSVSTHRRPPGWLDRVGRTSLGLATVRGAKAVRRLELAGQPFTVEGLAGRKIALACAGAAAAVLTVPGLAGVPMALMAAMIGMMTPDALLSRRAKRRQYAMELRIPDLVEVLVATAEAGLAPAVALSRSATVLHGPLAQELERAAGEIELGVPWRVALEHLVARTDVPSLRRLVAALARSNRLGGAVRAALRGVAADLRAARRLRSEELARRAPVKMLFPLVFLILPAFLLLTVGPVVLATLRSLQSG
jgi:tight adherence protein C